MKSIMRKTIAGISALAMTAAMTATTIPAFASEYEEIEKEQFVSSYATDDSQMLAEYFLNIGYSIDETASIMADFENQPASLATNSGNSYYSGNLIKKYPHYVAFIASNPMYAKGKPVITLSGNVDMITDFSGLSSSLTYGGYTGNYSLSDPYYDTDEYGEEDTSVQYIDATFSNLKSYPNCTTPKAFGTIYVNFTSNIKSEAQLYNEIGFSYMYGSTRCVITHETYVYADLNHDGTVDSQDFQAIATYMACLQRGETEKVANQKLLFGFDDIGEETAIELAKLSADINRDGILNDDDVKMYQKVASGQITL